MNSFSQSKKITSKDETLNSEMILNGKFIQEIKYKNASKGYFMIIKEGFRWDYFQDGKYFTKSEVKMVKPNLYNSIAIESTLPGFKTEIKEIVQFEVLETSTKENLIKIREKGNNSKLKVFLLRKTEN
jgi:hypothetical protein